MRKIVTLGLLALVLGLVSSSLFAGNVDACEAIKGEKSLYGLCNAWHNADNENAKRKILDSFNRRAAALAGPGGRAIEMPGMSGSGFSCPCWAGVELDEFSVPMWCYVADFTQVQFGFSPPQIFSADGNTCYYGDGSGPDLPDENGICVTELMDIVDEYFEQGALCY